jgi:hypothetical protein
MMLDRDPAVYEAQKARAKQILDRAWDNGREVCSFGLVGEDYDTGGTDTSWEVIQGTTGLVTAKCQDDGYLHYVLMSAKPGTPMLIKRNQPVRGGRASTRIAPQPQGGGGEGVAAKRGATLARVRAQR